MNTYPYSEYHLVDTSVGGVYNRNVIQEATVKLSGVDAYKTYFRYPDEFQRHFDKNIDSTTKKKSVSRYSGPAYADFFPVDIDCNNDIPKALDLLINTLCVLENQYDVNIKELRVFFSGSKGFHLYIPAAMMGITPSENISRYFKAFAAKILKPIGVSYDPLIYDIVRLWRVSNSINSKSGLYKIELTPTEVFKLTAEEIVEMAREKRTVEYVSDPIANNLLTATYRSIQELPTISGETIVAGVCPRNEKQCYHRLLQGVGEGKRDAVCFRLANHFQKKGYDSGDVEGLLQAWNKKNQPPMSENEVKTKVRSAFNGSRADFGCNDEILQEYCSDQCYLKSRNTTEEPSGSVVYTHEDTLLAYKKQVRELKQVRITLPIPKLGSALRGISPGECLYIIARAGVGKTAGLLNIFQWIARTNKEPMLFFSMEQPVPQIFERQAQLATGIGGQEIENIFLHDPVKAKMIAELTRESFQNILVVEKSGLSVEEMEKIILVAEKEHCGGKPIRLVAMDYMGLISGKGKDNYAQVSGQAKDLQAMLKNIGKAGIVLSQVSRAGGSGETPLTMNMIRDSGVVEEAATAIIGMWRLEGQADMIRMELLKTKHGCLGMYHDFRFIKPSLRFDDPDETIWDDKVFDASQFGQEVTM